jgi:(p)ppGpp synthase/HD superfamily hydrolase
MTENQLLEDAIHLASEAHRGQKDKAGKPYILHPMRVMFRMDTLLEMVVAVLHDVVEDSDTTLGELRAWGYPEEVVEALDCLTRRYADKTPERQSESYMDYVARCKANPLAKKVKLADIDDHLDYLCPGVSAELQIRYCKAYRFLKEE